MTRFLVLSFFCSLFAHAELFRTRVSDLKVINGDVGILKVELRPMSWSGTYRSSLPVPRFKSFGFVMPDGVLEDSERRKQTVSDAWVVLDIKTSAGRKGFLDVWQSAERKWVTLSCEINASRLKECDEKESEKAWKWFARHQLRSKARGGLWYQNRIGDDQEEVRDFEFDRTFTTLSGGRALAENLALDRDLILGRGEDRTEVSLDEIKGVTVAPIPWKEWMPEGEIAVDILSRYIPEDQHVMVAPSLKKLFALIDRIEEAGTPVLQSFALSDQYRGLPARYRSQMGLDLPEALARLLPIKSVAVTGGDPFFPTGSDVAVVLETAKADFVYSTLERTISAKARLAGASAVGGEGEFGFQNETRSFSCYLAKLDGAVVIANSAVQISRLRQVAEGKVHPLGDTDEYRFFRHRYPMGKNESAYVFISDACLRRWSGPAVRIGASRRSRALGALGAVTSRQLERGALDQSFKPLLGDVSLAGEQVLSENYGTLGFVTPIGELNLKTVTGREKQGYDRWRRGYESGWARFFDPIAIQLELEDDREGIDMTILPLRVDSDYEEMVALAGDAILSEAARQVPEESAFHFAMAVDKESDLFKQAGVSLIDLLPSLSINPLGWMGNSISVTLGEDLVWRSDIGEDSFKDMPVLIRVDVESRIKLALFLTALKGAIEASSPDLVTWETREHGDYKYVAVVGDPDEVGVDISLYYAARPTGLLVSLNEDMLKRALDREEKVEQGKQGKGQIMVRTSPQFLTSFGEMASDQTLEERRRNLSYQALPILNEWFKSFQAKDPQAFHQARFSEALTCPGGLGYRWNEEDLTMESVAFGHPGRKSFDAKPLNILKKFQSVQMDGSFEEGGMRVKVGLAKQQVAKGPEISGAPRPSDDKVIKLASLFAIKEGMTQKFEITEQGPDEAEEKTTKGEFVVTKTTQEGGSIIVNHELKMKAGEEDAIEKVRFQLDADGLRLISRESEWKMVTDGVYPEMPGELWPGQIFKVRLTGSWNHEEERNRLISDHLVKIIGWEELEVLKGKTMKVLRVEKEIASLFDDSLTRTKVTEWYAPDLGIVKVDTRSRWQNSTSQVTEVTMPEKE